MGEMTVIYYCASFACVPAPSCSWRESRKQQIRFDSYWQYVLQIKHKHEQKVCDANISHIELTFVNGSDRLYVLPTNNFIQNKMVKTSNILELNYDEESVKYLDCAYSKRVLV